MFHFLPPLAVFNCETHCLRWRACYTLNGRCYILTYLLVKEYSWRLLAGIIATTKFERQEPRWNILPILTRVHNYYLQLWNYLKMKCVLLIDFYFIFWFYFLPTVVYSFLFLRRLQPRSPTLFRLIATVFKTVTNVLSLPSTQKHCYCYHWPSHIF